MDPLLQLDEAQLTRLDRAIAALSGLPGTERSRKHCLLRALESERQELIRCNPAIRTAFRRNASLERPSIAAPVRRQAIERESNTAMRTHRAAAARPR